MDPIERYLQRVADHLDVPPADHELIVAELRSHLHDKTRDAHQAQPNRPVEDVQRQVLRDLGDPAALALAYGPGGRVELRDAEGRTLLRFSEAVRRAGRSMGKAGVAVGRSTGKAVRTVVIVLLIVFGVALTSATVLTLVLFDDVALLVRGYGTESVHHSNEACYPQPCSTTGPIVRSFYIHQDAREVRFDLDVRLRDTANGTFEVRVEDPNGNVMLQRTWTSGTTATFHDHHTWPPVAGTWRVEYRFASFAGSVSLDVETLGLPA